MIDTPPLPPDRVLAKYPITGSRQAIYRWDLRGGIGPMLYPEDWMAAAVELREALATVLEEQRVDRELVEQAKRLRQGSRLLFVAKRVLIGALDKGDLQIAVDEHEAVLSKAPPAREGPPQIERGHAWKKAIRDFYLYATSEMADEIRDLLKRLEATEQREGKHLRAHLASFGALCGVSLLTDLEGEVDEYEDVVASVARLRKRMEAAEEQLWQSQARRNTAEAKALTLELRLGAASFTARAIRDRAHTLEQWYLEDLAKQLLAALAAGEAT